MGTTMNRLIILFIFLININFNVALASDSNETVVICENVEFGERTSQFLPLRQFLKDGKSAFGNKYSYPEYYQKIVDNLYWYSKSKILLHYISKYINQFEIEKIWDDSLSIPIREKGNCKYYDAFTISKDNVKIYRNLWDSLDSYNKSALILYIFLEKYREKKGETLDARNKAFSILVNEDKYEALFSRPDIPLTPVLYDERVVSYIVDSNGKPEDFVYSSVSAPYRHYYSEYRKIDGDLKLENGCIIIDHDPEKPLTFEGTIVIQLCKNFWTGTGTRQFITKNGEEITSQITCSGPTNYTMMKGGFPIEGCQVDGPQSFIKNTDSVPVALKDQSFWSVKLDYNNRYSWKGMIDEDHFFDYDDGFFSILCDSSAGVTLFVQDDLSRLVLSECRAVKGKIEKIRGFWRGEITFNIKPETSVKWLYSSGILLFTVSESFKLEISKGIEIHCDAGSTVRIGYEDRSILCSKGISAQANVCGKISHAAPHFEGGIGIRDNGIVLGKVDQLVNCESNILFDNSAIAGRLQIQGSISVIARGRSLGGTCSDVKNNFDLILGNKKFKSKAGPIYIDNFLDYLGYRTNVAESWTFSYDPSKQASVAAGDIFFIDFLQDTFEIKKDFFRFKNPNGEIIPARDPALYEFIENNTCKQDNSLFDLESY
jgi:hypothetical protein